MASGTIKRNISLVQHTQTVTTSASGSSALSAYPSGTPISGRCTSRDAIVIPVLSKSGAPWVKVVNWDLSPVSNTSVTVLVTFLG